MAALYGSFRQFYQDGKFSDLFVTCGPHKFTLHRVIVCPQSKFFDDAVTGAARGRENEPISKIDLCPKYDPVIFEKVVQFMYTGNYEDEENMSPVYPTRAADLSVADLVAESKTKTVFMDMEFAESDDEDDEDFSGSNSDCSDDDDSEASNTIEGEDSDEEDDDDEDQDMEDDENDEDVTGFMTICGFESEDEAELQANEEAEADDHVYILKANQEKDIEPADYKTKVPHAMFTSVGVFLMALRLGVPPLQVLAHERFYRSMEKMLLPGVLVANPLPGDIPAVIDRVYSTPELVSTILADSCATFIQANYENDDLRAGIEPILAKHSGLAVKVLHRYMDYTKSKYWRLRDGPGCD